MIGLHGSQREADVLAGLTTLLSDPEQYRAKIDSLKAAAEHHRVMMEGAHKARLEAKQAAAEAHKRAEAAVEAEKSLKQAQAALDDTHAQLTAKSKRLEDAVAAHEAAVSEHAGRVLAHEKRVKQLQVVYDNQQEKAKALEAREAEVRKAESHQVELTNKLHALLSGV